MIMGRQVVNSSTTLESRNDNVIVDPLSTHQERLCRLSDVVTGAELYTALLNNAQQLRVDKGGTVVGTVCVINYAETPYRPIKPKYSIVVLLSVLLGLFAGLVSAFVRKAIVGGVEGPGLIENRWAYWLAR